MTRPNSGGTRSAGPAATGCLLAALAVLGCGKSPTMATYTGEDHTESFTQANFTRFYHVHVPQRSNPGPVAPLVLAFHGVGQSGKQLRELTGLDQTADEHGFIVVYMEAAMGAWDTFGGLSNLGLDDISYVRRVMDQVTQRHVVDKNRIIAVGFSNGGVLVQKLGCDLSNRIVGFVAVGATMLHQLADECHPDLPVSALYILGTEDRQFPLDGGSVLRSIDGTMDLWAKRNRCDSGRTRTAWPDDFDDGTRAYWSRHNGCERGARVWLDSIVGGGHTWPGNDVPPSIVNGLTSRDVSANLEIVRFLDGLRRD